MVYLRTIIVFCLPALFFISLAASCRLTNERFVVVNLNRPEKAVVAIGPFINRDAAYRPYVAANFADMIAFHLGESGYRIVRMDILHSKPIIRKKRGVPKARRSKSGRARKDNADNMLPRKLRHAAGEIKPAIVNERLVRLLNRGEVTSFAARADAKYFIQGIIARSESGAVLDVEESYIVLVYVHARDGRKIGAMNYVVRGRDLMEATFMKSVSKRIARAFDKEIRTGRRKGRK